MIPYASSVVITDANNQKHSPKAQCTKGKYTLETTMRKQNNQSR